MISALLPLVLLSAVSNPFPGVKLVRTGNSALAVVNLCAPGVSVRATRYGERKGTPQTWASRVGGAQVAINADFFDFPGWSYVVGRARGGGQDWPAGAQGREPRPYWEFGPHLAELVANGATAPAAAAVASDIVAGHNLLIVNGVSRGPNFDGDAVITTAHRRTAVGLSKDRRTLFLYASNDNLTGTGVVSQLVAMQREAGAPAIDVATNMDGGGSSQLYVAGLGQIIASGREVNNHLGVFARGSGAAPMCNQVPPRGHLDAASCSGVTGWAQDPNDPDAAIAVHVYYGGAAGAAGVPGKSVPANLRRADLCAALGGSCDHGFTAPAPQSWFDGKPHLVHAYGIDSEGGPARDLPNPLNFSCAQTTPTGVKRHVLSQTALTAWGLSAFWHVRPVLDAPLGALGEDLAWPDAPVMWRAPPDTRVFLIDQGFKRHVPSAAVAANWGLDLSKVVTKSPAQVDALPLGPALPANRVVVKGTGSAVYVLDVALPRPAVDAGTPTPDAGVEPFDAGVEPLDGGDEVDGGPSEPSDVDGGENVADDEPDAGDGSPTLPADPADPEPHGCAAAPGGALLMLALASRRRARRS